MKLLKPAWIGGDGKPLYSIDIHPDGTRFATGGQGDDSGKIVVWNMAPVRSESEEMDERVPKILCTMTNHLGCVNCVRWSHDGSMLASGADDGLVMIWEHRASQMQFGSAEVWSCVFILKRHDKDILDLAWSPDDSKLATCSIDNTVRIWDANNLPDLLATVSGHNGHVKGVTWDPVGKYLASQSVDKTVKIWRTSDWKEEATIKGPFEGCGETTYVLRLSWSPDGQTIVSAHALNNQGPVAKIIERDKWHHSDDFVGHRKAVEVVRFNPRILTKNGSSAMYSCCALGSRDRSLSIWLTSLKRPLVVTHDLFQQSVIDLSWSSSGYELMLCSLDGTVAYVEFTPDELGKPISNDQKDGYFIENYGRATGKDSNDQKLIENPDILGLQLPSPTKLTNSSRSSVPFLAAPQDNPPPLAVLPSASGTVKGIAVASSTSQNSPVKEKQKETKTKDGRRRITPVALDVQSSMGAPAAFLSSSQPLASVPSGPSSQQAEKLKEPAASTTPSAISVKISSVKMGRPKGSGDAGGQKPSAKRKKDDVSSPSAKRQKNGKITSVFSTSHKDDASSISVSLTSTMGISLPQSRIEAVKSLQISDPSKETVTLEVRNSSLIGRVHRLSYRQGDQQQWETCISSRCTAIAGSRYLVAVACENKTLHVFTCNGKRLFPGIVLPSLVSVLQCSGHRVMAVTTGGQIFVWDAKQGSVVIKGESLGPILKGGAAAVSLTKILLTEEGIPVVCLSNQTSYAFDPSLGTWILVHDSADNTKLSASVHSYTSGLDFAYGPLASIQGAIESTRRQGVERLHSISSDAGQRRLATEAFLESQVASSLALCSPKEYHFWLLAFVKCLTKQSIEYKLRDICTELAGPPTSRIRRGNSSLSSNSFILGFSKRNLLKELLSIMASNSSLQRLVSEMNEQIQ